MRYLGKIIINILQSPTMPLLFQIFLTSICPSFYPDDCKSTPPPTLEPTGLALSPPPGDTPQEPPTLRPMTSDPRTSPCPPKRLKLNSESQEADSDAAPVISCTKPEDRPPENKLINGLSTTESPARPTMGGVGRRTSVLFKKAKNGAKLQRERDNQMQNGNREEAISTDPDPVRTPNCIATIKTETSAQPKPSTPPPISTLAKQRARSRSCSPERERTPPRLTLEPGKENNCITCCITTDLMTFTCKAARFGGKCNRYFPD